MPTSVTSGNPEHTASVFVVGEALVDVVVDVDGAQRRHPGGSPTNVAFGLARLGVPTRLLTSFGDDEDGRLVANHLNSAGVALDVASVVARTTTSTALARIGADGVASYSFDVRWDLPPGRSVPPETRIIHSGSIAAALEPGAARVLELFEDAGSHVLRSFDPNVRPAITPDRGAVLQRIEGFARHSDVLKLSDEDAAWLFPGADPSSIARWAFGLGVGLFVLTRGAEGCVVATPTRRIAQVGIPTRVIDTIGAGDAFMSALIAGLLRWDLAEEVRAGAIEAKGLVRLASFAQRAASLVVARAGADLPTWAEVSEAIGA